MREPTTQASRSVFVRVGFRVLGFRGVRTNDAGEFVVGRYGGEVDRPIEERTLYLLGFRV